MLVVACPPQPAGEDSDRKVPCGNEPLMQDLCDKVSSGLVHRSGPWRSPKKAQASVHALAWGLCGALPRPVRSKGLGELDDAEAARELPDAPAPVAMPSSSEHSGRPMMCKKSSKLTRPRPATAPTCKRRMEWSSIRRPRSPQPQGRGGRALRGAHSLEGGNTSTTRNPAISSMRSKAS